MLRNWRSKISRLRRRLGRSESIVRWLGLSPGRGMAPDEGLILVQIDGLSRAQFEKALKRGRLPFLRKLLRKKGYQIRSMYSGLPSSTPAVQGELFYGVKCAVPAFSYRDPTTGRQIRMFDSLPAKQVEQRLASQGSPLLTGGSAYSNIYSGGAGEAHFCASTMGWSSVRRSINPLVLGGILLWHLGAVIRTCVLAVIEFFLAWIDFFGGRLRGGELFKELKFVPMRIGVSVVLREMITAAACVDVTRGLKVVQLNYLGYDEQAHRRGPSSKFAHWTLKGIDDSIARVWGSARRSQHRRYTLWVYSDHGQDRTIPYARKHGRTIDQAISEIFGQQVVHQSANSRATVAGVGSTRVQWLGGRVERSVRKRRLKAEQRAAARKRPRVPDLRVPPGTQSNQIVEVTSMGPVGHVYPMENMEAQRIEQLAQAMVHQAGIPLVLTATVPSGARAWTKDGVFQLPEQAARVFGVDHPYLHSIAEDIVCLCHHPHAGVFIICGWAQGAKSVSFAAENGSHAGAGIEETSAFILAPGDAPLPEKSSGYLRPLDLRIAIQRMLGTGDKTQAAELPRVDALVPTVEASQLLETPAAAQS